MLDLIMGKSDSLVMKEKMSIALDESMEVDQRAEALDDFEMVSEIQLFRGSQFDVNFQLIELMDNANNMTVLKLWDPLLSLLVSSHSAIVSHACWVIGTAVQNNLKAQAAVRLPFLQPILSQTFRSYISTEPSPSFSPSSTLHLLYPINQAAPLEQGRPTHSPPQSNIGP